MEMPGVISEEQVIFLAEVQAFASAIRARPSQGSRFAVKIASIRNTARLLGCADIARLAFALEKVYKSVWDAQISCSGAVQGLLVQTAGRLLECCILAQGGIFEAADPQEVQKTRQYVLCCDKAASGELFELPDCEKRTPALEKAAAEPPLDRNVELRLSDVNRLLSSFEDMISRMHKVSAQVESLKDEPVLKEQLEAELSLLQTALADGHAFVRGFAGDDSRAPEHQVIYGFFVHAAARKFFIPAEHIVDIVSPQPDGRLTLDGNSVPVYSLAALFPGHKDSAEPASGTILVAGYQGRRVGIWAESVQKFGPQVQLPMPGSFCNFPILRGLVLDEKYDLIPVLYVPELLRRFGLQDVYTARTQKTPAASRPRKILVADASESARQVVCGALRASGYETASAPDGSTALELLRAASYDLLVADAALPQLDGNSLVGRLRRTHGYELLPVIVLSSEPAEEADAVIDKSRFRRADLIAKVKELLHE